MEQDNRYQPPQSKVSDVATVAEGELASAGARLGVAILDRLFSAVLSFPRCTSPACGKTRWQVKPISCLPWVLVCSA
jgi:hypothetical protein